MKSLFSTNSGSLPQQQQQKQNDSSSSSYFQKTVCLYNWWLTKSKNDFQGKRLAVAGFTSKELQPVRLFTSAAIVKRHDVFTLDTADGICVILKGFINKSRTSDNGFPSEVFKQFLFGFPINWEKYAEKLLEEECSAGIESKNASEFNNSTRDPEVAGMRDSIPNLTPCENELKSVDKNDIKDKKDNSCQVSEKIAVDAFKSCNLHNHVPNQEGKAENNPSISPNEGQTSVAASPGKNDVDYIKNNSTDNVPPSLGCHINAFSSLEDNVAVTEEHPGHSVMGSSVRMRTPESSRRGKQKTMVRSKRKGSVNIELSTSPVVRNCNTLELSGKCGDTVQSGEETNHGSPSMVNTDTANGTPNNFRSRKSTNCLRNRNDNQKQNRCFVKHKNKESASLAFERPDGEQLKGSSSHTVIHSGRKIDTSEATPSRSVGRIAKSLSRNLRSKEKKEQVAVQEECSSGNKTKRKIIFDTPATPLTDERKEKVSITSPESLKRSRSGRLLVPTLDFWRNQIPIYDADRRLTGIQEGLKVVKPSRGSRSEPQKKRR